MQGDQKIHLTAYENFLIRADHNQFKHEGQRLDLTWFAYDTSSKILGKDFYSLSKSLHCAFT